MGAGSTSKPQSSGCWELQTLTGRHGLGRPLLMQMLRGCLYLTHAESCRNAGDEQQPPGMHLTSETAAAGSSVSAAASSACSWKSPAWPSAKELLIAFGPATCHALAASTTGLLSPPLSSSRGAVASELEACGAVSVTCVTEVAAKCQRTRLRPFDPNWKPLAVALPLHSAHAGILCWS